MSSILSISPTDENLDNLSVSPTDENFAEKLDNSLQLTLRHFDKKNYEHYCISMYYDLTDEKSHIKIINKDTLCNMLFDILQEIKDYYDHNPNRTEKIVEVGYFTSSNYRNFIVLSFGYVNVSGYLVFNDWNDIAVVDDILRVCNYKDDLNKFLQTIEGEGKMMQCYNTLHSKYTIKNGRRCGEFIKTEKTPREKIPREKTLSKKEKEKLKKQKAKEANKLREQEKKDKAKLAEQQAKQFEKQQKERERKRIETARKKKLALLKK